MSESKTSPNHTEEEIIAEAERIKNKLRHIAIFNVGLPSGDTIEQHEVRRAISTRFMLLLEELKVEYPELTLDYNFAYMMRTPEKVSLD